MTAAILGAHGGSVRLLDTDQDGEPDTLYIADSPDPETARMVWRFNYQGWGASQNGYNGPFQLGATFQDGGTLFANVLKVMNIDADNITTGTINADSINVTNINGQNIKDRTIGSAPLANSAVINRTISGGAVTGGSGGKIAGSTITTANTVSGINTSLGYADFSHGVFNGTNTASYVRASTLIIQGGQYTPGTISFVDGNGNIRTFYTLLYST